MTVTHPVFGQSTNLPECDLPAVHLNGTGRDVLLHQYIEAHRALTKFCTALASVECHARDYYPISPSAYIDARTTRSAVFDLCDEIQAYIDEHIRHLSK